MIIFCAGLRSSASTLQWQIASEIVGTHGFIVHRANEINRYMRTHKIAVAKQHKFTFEKYIANSDAKVLMTIRDVRDVQASLMQRWNKSFSHCFKKLCTFVEQQEEWMQFSHKMYFARYEDWTNNLFLEVLNIADFLNIQIDDNAAQQIANKYSLDNNRKRLKENHITDAEVGKYKRVLTSEQIQHIEFVFDWWLNKYNYSKDV